MEQNPYQGDEQQSITDAGRIYHGITEALREQRSIDHGTARTIAAQLHGGQDSPLYALAASGALVAGLPDELDGWRREDTSVEFEPWLDALDDYLDSRADHPGPVEGWAELWPPDPATDIEQDEPDTSRPDSFAAAIGQAVVTASLPESADEQVSEPLPAAGRIHTGIEAADREGRQIDDRTAQEIARQLDPQPGSALEAFIACGAIRNEDDELFRELYADWPAHDEQQQRLVEALRSYVATRGNEGPVAHWCEDDVDRETASSIQPEIWVGSLSDYNNGLLHGMWIDANREPEELHERISWILRTSPAARAWGEPAEEWGIFDHSGFCGYAVSEWSSLDTVSLVARGIAEHGAAYAAWVSYVGDTSGELLEDERFRDHYLGEWSSLADYVEHVLDETGVDGGLDEALQAIPEDLRRHVRVDVDGLAQEWEQGLHVVEGAGGNVWVFDARA
jgi:antirestriction protein